MQKYRTPGQKIGVGIILAVVAAILIISFVKGIDVKVESSNISVSGGVFYSDDIKYDDIKSVEVKDDIVYGTRTNGMSMFQYRIGAFSNDEFGKYKLYVNTGIKEKIVVTRKDGSVVAFNYKDEDSTDEIYKSLLEKVK